MYITNSGRNPLHFQYALILFLVFSSWNHMIPEATHVVGGHSFIYSLVQQI